MTRPRALIHNGKRFDVGQPIRIPATKQEGVIVGVYPGNIERDNLITLRTSDGSRIVLMPDSVVAL